MTRRSLTILGLLMAFAMLVAACSSSDADDTTTSAAAEPTTTEAMEESSTTAVADEAEPTIIDAVRAAAAGDPAEFTVLLTALETADLDTALAGEGPFTVFAPTDAAFATLLGELGATAEELLAREDLGNILLYHVVGGAFSAEDVIALAPADVPTLNDGQTVAIAIVDDQVVINDSATVIQADVLASNGVVHVIDAVLIPAS